MQTPSGKGAHPEVWLGWWRNRSAVPHEIQSRFSFVIKLESWEDLPHSRRNVVLPCTVSLIDGAEHFVCDAKIAFLETPEEQLRKPDSSEKDLDREWMSLSDFRSRFGQFVLSIGNRRAYQTLFQTLAPEAAVRVLLQVNDLVVLNDRRPKSRLLHSVRTSLRNLWDDFFREDEERFTLIDFRRAVEAFDKVSSKFHDVAWMEAEVPLWRGHFVLPLRLNFPEVLGQRQLLNVVIGPNGSGKTNLLLGLARCVVNRRARFGIQQMTTSSEGVQEVYEDMPSTRVAVFTYERSMWTSLRRKGVAVYEQGVRSTDWRALTELVYQIITSARDIEDGRTDLRLLREILGAFVKVEELWFPLHPAPLGAHHFDESQLGISLEQLADRSGSLFTDAVSRLDRRRPPNMRTGDGRPYTLSSGERSLVLFCARVMTASRDGALVLVDEPENHLHPQFITLMIQTLARTLQATSSRALVVTHSPFVVREFDRNTVRVMKTSEDGVPELFKPSLQTLGADVAMISDYVFEDEKIRKGFQESIDRAMRRRGAADGSQLQLIAAGLGDDGLNYLIEKAEAKTREAPDA